jgi:hypothetical protein
MLSRFRHGWPRVPQNAEAWIALPEIGQGRHLLADIGWVSSRRERVVAAGITGLPPPIKDVDDGFVSLPAVTVVDEHGRMKMFRLPLPYIGPVRQFALREHRGQGDILAFASEPSALPGHFVIGDGELVYLLHEEQPDTRAPLN